MRITGGIYRGRVLKTASGPGYRPATSKIRQAVFSMLEARGLVWEESRVLDCFAGSGSLAFESLSRGAAGAVLIEKSKSAAALIRENARALGLESDRCTVLAADVLEVLRTPPARAFEVVFVDPPYGKGLLWPCLERLVSAGWLKPDGFLLAEVEAGVDPSERELGAGLELAVQRSYGQTTLAIWT